MADVRRDVEPLWIGLYERRLHSRGRGADKREAPVTVVVIPDRRERALAPDEEGGRAVRRPLARLRKVETFLANGAEDLLLRHERDLALRQAAWSRVVSTRGSSSASRALRT